MTEPKDRTGPLPRSHIQCMYCNCSIAKVSVGQPPEFIGRCNGCGNEFDWNSNPERVVISKEDIERVRADLIESLSADFPNMDNPVKHEDQTIEVAVIDMGKLPKDWD